jgi:F-type H+-transporting ATPase subunit alpha
VLGRFEQELYRFAENSHPALLKDIREKKAIDDTLKGQIEAALKEFKGRFTV